MIKNRTAQLVYLSAACTVGVLGAIASLGLFTHAFRWDFYTYFTNISNYFCIAVLFAELVQTIRKKEDSYVNTAPILKFMGMVSILLTFLFYNIMLAPDTAPHLTFSFRSISLHIIIPIIYIADWFLFYERKRVTLKYPFYSLILPALYLVYVAIHAIILKFDSTIPNFNNDGALIYPYFFLDIENTGVPGVLMWIGALIVGLLLFGFIFYGLDRIIKTKND